MPRGQNPKSMENLKKGRRFGNGDDSATIDAVRAGRAGAARQAAMASLAEEMRGLLTDERRRQLALQLVDSMPKSPEWYKLGLRMLGELPPEHMEVLRPREEIAMDIMETLRRRREELKAMRSQEASRKQERA